MVDPNDYQQLEIEEGKFLNLNKHIQGDVKQQYLELLRKYKDVFAWSHNRVEGGSPSFGRT